MVSWDASFRHQVSDQPASTNLHETCQRDTITAAFFIAYSPGLGELDWEDAVGVSQFIVWSHIARHLPRSGNLIWLPWDFKLLGSLPQPLELAPEINTALRFQQNGIIRAGTKLSGSAREALGTTTGGHIYNTRHYNVPSSQHLTMQSKLILHNQEPKLPLAPVS